MNATRSWLIPVSVSLAILALAGCLCTLALSVRATAVCLPGMLATAQDAALARVDRLQATIDALPDRIVPPVVAAARVELRHGVDSAGGKVDAAIAEIAAWRGMVDGRVADIAGKIDSRSGQALAAAEGAAALVKPTIENTAALLKNAGDSWDDLYPDIKATVASSTVAVTSVAHASEAMRDAAPRVAESVVSIGRSSAAIAADVRREVDAATKPKKWWQKALGPFYTIGRLGAVLL